MVNGEIAKDPNSDTPLEVNERNTDLLSKNKVPLQSKRLKRRNAGG